MIVLIEILILLAVVLLIFMGVVVFILPFLCIYHLVKQNKKKIWILFLLLVPFSWIAYIKIEKPKIKDFSEFFFHGLVMFAALCSIIFLFGIIFSLFANGYKIFTEYGLLKFITGIKWYPTTIPAHFGILPIILGSFLITALSIFIALPLGVGSALYISEIATPVEKEILKPIIELLASIPSVIYGLFGMLILSNFVREVFGLRTGFNAFTASIILALMITPIISSISEDAINSVPRSLREASLALGANRWETTVRVVLPAAKEGVITSIILGVGRAIGETMVVLMVAGNSAIIPRTIFDSVRPMTSTIAAEMGETPVGSMHFFALFGIGIILFVITFILNIITDHIRERMRKRHL